MKIEIKIPSNPAEYSSHFRKLLYEMLVQLDFKIKLKGRTSSLDWQELIAIKDSKDCNIIFEWNVDAIYNQLKE